MALGRVVIDKDIFKFPYISLCKTFDPEGGAIFGYMGHTLNKLDRSLLDDDAYQISRF